jgi:hypothetical protein
MKRVVKGIEDEHDALHTNVSTMTRVTLVGRVFATITIVIMKISCRT